jgi:hypothetical protein
MSDFAAFCQDAMGPGASAACVMMAQRKRREKLTRDRDKNTCLKKERISRQLHGREKAPPPRTFEKTQKKLVAWQASSSLE